MDKATAPVETERREPARRRYQYVRTVKIVRLSQRALQAGTALYPPAETDAIPRPRTWGECQRMGLGARGNPCTNLRCAYHLAIDVDLDSGNIKLNAGMLAPDDGVPEIDLAAMPATCALRVAEEGGLHLELVGHCLGITRERVRQIEARVTRRLREHLPVFEDLVPEPCRVDPEPDAERSVDSFVLVPMRPKAKHTGSKR